MYYLYYPLKTKLVLKDDKYKTHKIKCPILEIFQSSQKKKNTDYLLKWKFEYMFPHSI